MKTRLFKTIAAMVLLFTAIPMHSQNYLKIWFKDGHTERHFMHLVQNISTTKYDLEGNLHSDYQMQQIVTPDTTYSYYIADIDSMSFRKVDEEQIINNVKTAISAIGPLFEQFNDSLSLARHIDDIQNIEGIANISLTETDMAVQIKDWRTLFFHFPHDGEYDSEEKYVRSIADFSERLGRKARLVQTKAPTINNPVKVAFINQQSNDISREYVEETWKRIVGNFNRLGFDATYIPSEKVTIKLLQEEMFDYDMVCLKTHGGYVNNKHWLLTGEVVDKSWFGKLFDSFDGSEDIDDVGVTEARWTYKFGHLFPSEENVDVYYKVISEDVIAKGNNRFFKDHNTVIFNSACSSLKGNFSLANMLVDEKGLDVYWGYDDTSDSEKNVLTAEYIFDYILNGCSADGAMNYLRSRHNEPDPGYTYHKNDLVNQYNRDIENGVVTREYITNLNLVSASQDCNEMFITKCKTIPTADEVAQKEYKESQKVNLIGLTTMLDKDNNEVKCGFVYSLDPTFADFNFVEASDIKDSGSSDGNVIFTAALTPPSLYQKVYYRAATYDGVYYNYDKSEPCNFTVRASLEVSPEYLDFKEVPLGESKQLSIEVKNTGFDPVMYSISIPDGTSFIATETEINKTLESGKSNTHMVTFTPTTKEVNSTIISIKTSAEINKNEIQLIGKGVAVNSDLSISTNTCLVTAGLFSHILITSGNGADCLAKSDNPEVASVSIEDNWLIIYGVKRGVALITVTDTRTGKIARVAVTVNSAEMENLKLSANSTDVDVDKTVYIDILSGNGSDCTVTSSNDNIAFGYIQRHTLFINGVSPGYAVITVVDSKTLQKDTVGVTVTGPADIPAEVKDLGLPSGTKWASYNVGASAPEEYGEYFAWGELKEKDVFNESNYQFCKNGIYANIGDDIGGTEYDVARERWGDKWIMPNKRMMRELFENCSTKWTTLNGVYGMEFTGPNGNTLFLPAAGYRKDDQQLQGGVWGDYWASTASEANTYSAYELYFKDGLINCDYIYNDNPTYRRNGHTVRPVIPGLQLTSNGPLSILMGESETVGVRYGSGSYRYEIDKEGIVSLEITGSTITIHALSGGDAVVTVIDNNGGKATISVAVKAIPEAKDLGLPSGTKWATFNVGANSPEEYGEYYAWGESGVKDAYTVSNYEYCKNGMYINIGKDIRGTEFDTAREKWGGEWMMPSTTQFNELIANCTSEWTTVNGVKGRKFTSKINGEYIFFPAAGYYGSSVSNTGSNGYYWSGNIDSDNAEKATNLSVKSGTPGFASNTRFYGFSVRPVISGLELSATGTLSMFEGNSRTVTIKSGSGSYQPEVDQEGVVSVSITGTTITINALKIGDVVFTVTDTKGGQKANIKINVRAVPKAIDLGLPSGTKWANINVGANSPEEFGDYYAWGETETKSVYTTSTYEHYKNSSYVDIGYDIRGSEYDAAQAKWGDKWKMPSSTQINELIANCTSEWTTVNGVNGCKFISKINGDSIFLPAVGYCESGVSSIGTSGYYWACDKVTDKNNGYNLGVKSSGPSLNAYSRYYGFALRPVIRENSDDPRMDEVIPENIRDKFKDHMPVYTGTNPPNIEGSYLISPFTVVFCEDGNWDPGYVIDTYKIRFFNQSSTDNTINMIDYNAENTGAYSRGTGAFISGDGTHFTASFSTEGYSNDIFNKTSLVISGTKTDNGIEDLYYGFVMVEKGSDPDNKLMKTGVYRVFKDGDGVCGPTTWEFESNARQMDSNDKSEAETTVDAAKPRKAGAKLEELQAIK